MRQMTMRVVMPEMNGKELADQARKTFQARELLEHVQGPLDLDRATRSGKIG